MAYGKVVSLVVSLFVVTRVQSYPSGAPTGVCSSMLPSHPPASPSNNTSIYTVNFTVNAYKPGQAVSVKIAGNQYKGFLLEARDAGQNIVGSWISPPSNCKLITCTTGNDAVTHSDNTPKVPSLLFQWKAPSENCPSKVTFYATVVQSEYVFWTMLKSADLQLDSTSFCPTTKNNAAPKMGHTSYTFFYTVTLFLFTSCLLNI
ncbi:putative defense protein 3 [Polypterus senegalus]|uniref:putative defense protein 3 n=1 Tax=Polypterus senegalus TaxID=55291 RepID=UPI0019627A2C|nr:putative defense protein 3 [Polypterus senegalus]